MDKAERIPVDPEILSNEAETSSWVKRILAVAAKIPFARNALAMWFAMQDPEVPAAKKLIIGGALLYFVSPIDIIPDFIPLIGKADDAAVIAAAFQTVKDIITDEHLRQADALLAKHAQP